MELLVFRSSIFSPIQSSFSPPCPESVVYISPYPDFKYYFSKVERIKGVKQPLSYLPNWNYEIYTNRLRTFRLFNWGFIKEEYTAEMFAATGFLYIVEGNILVCAFCLMQCNQLHYNDQDVFKEHQQNKRCYGNRKHAKDDPFFNAVSPDINRSICEKYYTTFVQFEGVDGFHKHKVDSQLYTSFQDRLLSFNDCPEIPPAYSRRLSEAGFYYDEDSDFYELAATCFCCGCSFPFEDDDANNEPWITHVYLSPKCKFLVLSKGNDFVQQTLKWTFFFPEAKALLKKNCIISMKRQLEVLNVRHCDVLDNINRSYELWSGDWPHKIWDSPEIREHNIEKPKKSITAPDDPLICKICLRNVMEVILLNCHHMVTCISCTVTQTHCPMCRVPINKALRVFLHIDDTELDFKPRENLMKELKIVAEIWFADFNAYKRNATKENVATAIAGKENAATDIAAKENAATDIAAKENAAMDIAAKKNAARPDSRVLCKICRKNEMSVVYLKCRHIVCCYECAIMRNVCPVCHTFYFGLLRVYL